MSSITLLGLEANFGVDGVAATFLGVSRTDDEIDDLADFGVWSLLIGDGVYDACKTLSVPSRIPSFDVANLCAAGDMVDTRTDKLPVAFGVLRLDLACWTALIFLSR